MPGPAHRLEPARLIPKVVCRLRGEEDGATIVEFALVSRVFPLAVLGGIVAAIVIFISSSI